MEPSLETVKEEGVEGGDLQVEETDPGPETPSLILPGNPLEGRAEKEVEELEGEGAQEERPAESGPLVVNSEPPQTGYDGGIIHGRDLQETEELEEEDDS